MQIREIKYGDLLEIEKIEKACIKDSWNYKMLAGAFLSGGYHGYVAEEDNKIIGYGSYKAVTVEGDIFNIAVLQEYRRRGVGEALLKSIIQNAKDIGVESLFLEVGEKNEGAIALYEKLGFTFLYERKKYYSDGENAKVLKLSIK